MSKVTSKLQVTLPKSIAESFNIKPGDQIEWDAAGETIRVIPARKRPKSTILPQDRLKHFDRATERQCQREKTLDRTFARCFCFDRPGMDTGQSLR